MNRKTLSHIRTLYLVQVEASLKDFCLPFSSSPYRASSSRHLPVKLQCIETEVKAPEGLNCLRVLSVILFFFYLFSSLCVVCVYLSTVSCAGIQVHAWVYCLGRYKYVCMYVEEACSLIYRTLFLETGSFSQTCSSLIKPVLS